MKSAFLSNNSLYNNQMFRSIKWPTGLSSHNRELLKVVLFISLSFSLCALWDIFGLKVEITFFYIFMKLFFIVVPPLLYLKMEGIEKSKLDLMVSLIFYFYSYINTVYVDISYYTAFLQFFIGTVYFMRYKVKDFLFSHFVGITLYSLSLLHYKTSLSQSEYLSQLQISNGATLPVFGISFLIFYMIKRHEHADKAKAVFFERIGQDVGFILHEIKQPLRKIQNSNGDIHEINELLETANIMWPTQKKDKRIQLQSLSLAPLVQEILESHKSSLEYIDVEFHTYNLENEVISHRTFTRIIIKKLIKNALEESFQNGKANKITLFYKEPHILIIENTIFEKKNIRDIFKAGKSTKSNHSNKGLGLYICKQLCEKMGAKIHVTTTHDIFTVKIEFPS